MSRNSDRANTVLFRYQEQRAEANGYIDYNSTQRPRSVQKVSTLRDAEQWRKQVLTEINQKVLRIQDVTLSDYQLRDLNDEINKLMRERLAWEYRIKELGGPDYRGAGNGRVLAGGVIVRGYRYFGRAKELPGVKELLKKQIDEKETEQRQRDNVKTQQQHLQAFRQRVGLAYYGYYDEQPIVSHAQGVRRNVLAHAKEVLGDLIDDDQDEDEQSTMITDELLKYERGVTRSRNKSMKKQGEASPAFVIDVKKPPVTLNQIEAQLVEQRRQQITSQLL